MTDRSKPDDTSLGMTELVVWVAGLAALAGLIAEVVRRTTREPSAALVGVMVVIYVVYVASSIRAFWKAPRIAVPVTLLIGGALWTITLQALDRSNLTRVVIALIFVPFATAYSVRLIGPNPGRPDDLEEGPSGPSLVHSLLDKGKGFGARSDRAA